MSSSYMMIYMYTKNNIKMVNLSFKYTVYFITSILNLSSI